MTTFLNDTFTDTNATVLSSHVGETGATWTKHASSGAGTASITTNRVHDDLDAANVIYYSSGTPASADYTVSSNIFVVASAAAGLLGITGRHATAADTFYLACYNWPTLAWRLYKRVAGTFTLLGSEYVEALATNDTRLLALDMSGTTIRLLVNGVSRISVTDTAISAAGKAGFWLNAGTTTASIHFSDISAGGTTSTFTQAVTATQAQTASVPRSIGKVLTP